MSIETTLARSFLFKGMDTEQIKSMISKHPPRVVTYKRGELVYSSADSEGLVGFVLFGRCDVGIHRTDGSNTVLNTLEPGGSFVILSVYSAEGSSTQIFAARNSDIAFFTAEQIRYFVKNYSQTSSNLINFLANRISFLNKKIVTFSANRVEARLAAFLLSESERLCETTFPFNCQRTSAAINAGRASVYRALASLENEGLIKFETKIVKLFDLKGLERIIK